MATPNGPWEEGYMAASFDDHLNPYITDSDEATQWEMGFIEWTEDNYHDED